MTTDMLTLSTALKATEKFLLDGQEYEMLTSDHLSIEDEALVMAWLSRHTILANELSYARDPRKGRLVAERLRDARLKVIDLLTTLTKEQAAALPTSQQALLLVALAKMVEMPEGELFDDLDEAAEADSDPDDAGAGAPDIE